jgi:hypothetical protein
LNKVEDRQIEIKTMSKMREFITMREFDIKMVSVIKDIEINVESRIE